MQLISFSWSSEYFIQSGNIQANCNSILFWNTGNVNVSILGGILYPGQYLELTGSVGEIDKSQYFFQFQGTGTTPQLNVLRKIYNV